MFKNEFSEDLKYEDDKTSIQSNHDKDNYVDILSEKHELNLFALQYFPDNENYRRLEKEILQEVEVPETTGLIILEDFNAHLPVLGDRKKIKIRNNTSKQVKK